MDLVETFPQRMHFLKGGFFHCAKSSLYQVDTQNQPIHGPMDVQVHVYVYILINSHVYKIIGS